jgi:hypothetical protein
MFYYALLIGGSSPTLYIERPDKLHTGNEIEVKRSEIKYWLKDLKDINTLFFKKGISEKPRDRDVNSYTLKLRIGTESGGRCLQNVNNITYEGFSAHLI